MLTIGLAMLVLALNNSHVTTANLMVSPENDSTGIQISTTKIASTAAPVLTRGCHDVKCACVTTATNASTNSTKEILTAEGSLDALLYIVVVLLFYAFSIVVLMVKYIRRENKEAYLQQYFDEFVAREQFQSAQARNQRCMKSIMDQKRHPDSLSQQKNDSTLEETSFQQFPPGVGIPHTIPESEEDDEKLVQSEFTYEFKINSPKEHSPTNLFQTENEHVTVRKDLVVV